MATSLNTGNGNDAQPSMGMGNKLIGNKVNKVSLSRKKVQSVSRNHAAQRNVEAALYDERLVKKYHVADVTRASSELDKIMATRPTKKVGPAILSVTILDQTLSIVRRSFDGNDVIRQVPLHKTVGEVLA